MAITDYKMLTPPTLILFELKNLIMNSGYFDLFTHTHEDNYASILKEATNKKSQQSAPTAKLPSKILAFGDRSPLKREHLKGDHVLSYTNDFAVNGLTAQEVIASLYNTFTIPVIYMDLDIKSYEMGEILVMADQLITDIKTIPLVISGYTVPSIEYTVEWDVSSSVNETESTRYYVLKLEATITGSMLISNNVPAPLVHFMDLALSDVNGLMYQDGAVSQAILPPAIDIPQSVMNPYQIRAGAASFPSLGVTATDEFGNALAVSSTSSVINLNTVGNYILEFSAIDQWNNQATKAISVEVIPTTAAIISLNTSNALTTFIGSNFTDPNATISLSDGTTIQIPANNTGILDTTIAGNLQLIYSYTTITGYTTPTLTIDITVLPDSKNLESISLSKVLGRKATFLEDPRGLISFGGGQSILVHDVSIGFTNANDFTTPLLPLVDNPLIINHGGLLYIVGGFDLVNKVRTNLVYTVDLINKAVTQETPCLYNVDSTNAVLLKSDTNILLYPTTQVSPTNIAGTTTLTFDLIAKVWSSSLFSTNNFDITNSDTVTQSDSRPNEAYYIQTPSISNSNIMRLNTLTGASTLITKITTTNNTNLGIVLNDRGLTIYGGLTAINNVRDNLVSHYDTVNNSWVSTTRQVDPTTLDISLPISTTLADYKLLKYNTSLLAINKDKTSPHNMIKIGVLPNTSNFSLTDLEMVIEVNTESLAVTQETSGLLNLYQLHGNHITKTNLSTHATQSFFSQEMIGLEEATIIASDTALNDSIYITGGVLNKVLEVTSTQTTPMIISNNLDTSLLANPIDVRSSRGVSASGLIYVFGGYRPDPVTGSRIFTNDFYVINTQSNVVTLNPSSIVEPRMFHTVNKASTHIYIIGGIDQSGQPIDTCWSYDYINKFWTSLAPMPNVRSGHTSTTSKDGNFITVSQGGKFGDIHYEESWEYDTANDTWKTIPNDHDSTCLNTLQAELPNNQGTFYIDKLFSTSRIQGLIYNTVPTPKTWSINKVKISQTYDHIAPSETVGATRYYVTQNPSKVSHKLDLLTKASTSINFNLPTNNGSVIRLAANSTSIYTVTTDPITSISSLWEYSTVSDTLTLIQDTNTGLPSTVTQGVSIFCELDTSIHFLSNSVATSRLSLTTYTIANKSWSFPTATPFMINTRPSYSFDTLRNMSFYCGEVNASTNLSIQTFDSVNLVFTSYMQLPYLITTSQYLNPSISIDTNTDTLFVVGYNSSISQGTPSFRIPLSTKIVSPIEDRLPFIARSLSLQGGSIIGDILTPYNNNDTLLGIFTI